MPLTPEELRALARALAPLILEEIKILVAPPTSDYLKGVEAIASYLGVCAKTIRRHVKAKKIPICGAEEFRQRGKIAFRPICKKSALNAMRENLSTLSQSTACR